MTDPTEPTLPTGDPRQPAHDAVFAFIRSLGEELPTNLVGRNAMIWRAVNAALDAMAAPAPPAAPSALRTRIAAAIRAAACTGDCGLPEAECVQTRVQPGVWQRGVLIEVEGTPEAIADAVLAVLPEPADRAAVLSDAADFFHGLHLTGTTITPQEAEAELRRLAAEVQQPECTCDPAPHREEDGTYSHWAGCRVADAEQQAEARDAAPSPRVAQLTEMLATEHCHAVHVDGEPILVRGSGSFTEEDAKFFGEIVRAAKRRYEAEHALADEARQPTEARARRPLTRWYVERHDHDGWAPASSPTRPQDRAIHHLGEQRTEHPGHQFRLVRATTTYTVQTEHTPEQP
ncbi:MAG TPA: hypothetical protein VIU15_39855 [Streptomyces sp.]